MHNDPPVPQTKHSHQPLNQPDSYMNDSKVVFQEILKGLRQSFVWGANQQT